MTDYVGAPWRSRFLRAPKVALTLASHPQFVALESLASVRLGLKTGADKFFFVSDVEGPALRGEVRVQGLQGGWSGAISSKDLLPAVLNPHRLFAEGRRIFTIPQRTGDYYLWPREREPQADLRDYVRLAETEGVHRTKLVSSNAGKRYWFRQVRNVIQSDWVLPYNSGYDYGAWSNRHHAVLNGRFIGVDAAAGVDPELLGAALNSTFVMIGRLAVGTATGTEGAFDVGPPAARLVAVPNVRLIPASQADAIKRVLSDWRAVDEMQPGPTSSSHVSPLRLQLDLAILEGLGLGRGEASALAGDVYESYARWRQAVERVEREMRGLRREMSRNRTGRAAKPIDLAAQRVWDELSLITPRLPQALLHGVDEFETVVMPRKSGAKVAQPSLMPGLVFHPDGTETSLGSYDRVRYVEMLQTIGFEPPFRVPTDSVRAGAIADAFRATSQEVAKSAMEKANQYLNAEDALLQVGRLVERFWLRSCRAAGMDGPHSE